ncbi:MAG: hypothetical protein JWQ92_1197 [Amnibacterium sp.]|nr:hypothetical protein [Amnibacterium sp.]
MIWGTDGSGSGARRLPISWRRLGTRLWAASVGGATVATVERGRRYTLIGPGGDVHGRFRTLEGAMAAVHLAGPAIEEPAAIHGAVVERALVSVTTAFGLGAVAVVGYAIAAGLL